MTELSPALEDLLDPRLPSAHARQDALLAAAGAADADIASTKDAVAAVGLAAAAPADPPPGVRDRLLASRQREGKYGVYADRIARLFDLPLADAAALMLHIEAPAAWTRFLVDGLEMIPVTAGPKCNGAITTLVRIQPGTRFPEHVHRGDETTLVLDGGFHEPAGAREEARRGDELFRPDGSEHALVALPGVPCVAAVRIFGHADLR